MLPVVALVAVKNLYHFAVERKVNIMVFSAWIYGCFYYLAGLICGWSVDCNGNGKALLSWSLKRELRRNSVSVVLDPEEEHILLYLAVSLSCWFL